MGLIDLIHKAGATIEGAGIVIEKGFQQGGAMIREKGIGIEMCPISNLQTKAVADTSEYPLREFLDAKVPVTINTDNRTVSNTSLTKELEFIQRVYGIRDEEILQMMQNAANTAFVDEGKKKQLLSKLQ